MSPARTIAPAVVFGVYRHLVAPLLGTIFGGLGAGMMYSYLFLFKPDEAPDAYVAYAPRPHPPSQLPAPPHDPAILHGHPCP